MAREGNIAVNQWIGTKERFADLCNGVMCGGERMIRPEDLEPLDRESDIIVTDKEGGKKGIKRYRDVVMRWKNGVDLAVLACESQQKVHYAMPVRSMIYDGLTYQQQIEHRWEERKRNGEKYQKEEYLSKMKKEERLRPVITLILYYGTEKWDGKQDIHGMLDTEHFPHKLLEKYVPNYHINLIDAGHMDGTKQFRTDLQLVFGMLKYRNNKQELLQYMEENKAYFGRVDEKTGYAICELLNSRRAVEFMKQEKGEMDMCQALEELYADGIAVGIEQGIEKGREQRTKIFVKNMLERGMSDEDIKALAECDDSVIKEVKQEMM